MLLCTEREDCKQATVGIFHFDMGVKKPEEVYSELEGIDCGRWYYGLHWKQGQVLSSCLKV